VKVQAVTLDVCSGWGGGCSLELTSSPIKMGNLNIYSSTFYLTLSNGDLKAI